MTVRKSIPRRTRRTDTAISAQTIGRQLDLIGSDFTTALVNAHQPVARLVHTTPQHQATASMLTPAGTCEFSPEAIEEMICTCLRTS